MKSFNLDVLGVNYTVNVYDETDDCTKFLELNACAFHNGLSHTIAIQSCDSYNSAYDLGEECEHFQLDCLKHELIHAHLYQSGLNTSSLGVTSWATNEEMIDYLALQWDKINDCIERGKLGLFNINHEIIC